MVQSTDIQTVLAQAKPNAEHAWTLTTAQLAEGYGVSPSTLRGNKKNNEAELQEGHHWLKDDLGHTHWTKAGTVRMGMFVKSDRAVQFRNLAEHLVLDAIDEGSVQNMDAPALPTSANLSTLDVTAEAIADVVVNQLSAEQVLQERVNFHVQAKLEAEVQAVDPASLGKSLAARWGLGEMGSLTAAIAHLTQQPQTEATAE